jgi:hypothetical protein
MLARCRKILRRANIILLRPKFILEPLKSFLERAKIIFLRLWFFFAQIRVL